MVIETAADITGGSQRSEQTVDNVEDIASSVDDAEHQTRRLASSYYALMTWVAVVSVAVVVVSVATLLRRARRPAPAVSVTSAVDRSNIDAVERCSTSSSLDLTLSEAAQVTSASELSNNNVSPLSNDRRPS